MSTTEGTEVNALPPELSEARFPVESWNQLVREANSMRVHPLLPEVERPLGEGQERFGFVYRLTAQNVSFEWWDAPPPEWKKLADWAARVRDAMNAWLDR